MRLLPRIPAPLLLLLLAAATAATAGGCERIVGPVPPPCIPLRCADLVDPCGEIDDGCGATIDCGDCVWPDTCGGGWVENQCGCSETAGELCERRHVTCGTLQAKDKCGNQRSVRCGDPC